MPILEWYGRGILAVWFILAQVYKVRGLFFPRSKDFLCYSLDEKSTGWYANYRFWSEETGEF